MKSTQLVLAFAAAGLAAAGGYALYRTGMNQGMQNVAAKAGAPAAASDRKVLYWHDPMVPGQRFDKPGKSPFMDMQLVPVYAEGGGDESKVSVSPRMQQNLGVRVAEVTRGVLAPALEAVGSVAYNERDAVVVQARASGFIERLHVRALLDPVRQGQPLAELYVPDWVAAQEEFLSLRRMQGRDLGSLVDGARQRMRLAGMTEDQAALVEATGKVQARQIIVAPAGGVVTELAAREGMTVAAGAPLFRINGLGTVWVNAEVPESLAAQVLPGNAVDARSPALAGTLFKGRVGAVLPEVNAATRTLRARIELANPAGRLLSGMFVTVNLAPAARKPVLQVPSEAVIQTGRRSVVVVALGEGKYASVDVEAGLEADGRTEIRKGLEAGQKIVVSGQFLIDSEAGLRASAGRMGDPVARETGQPGPKVHQGRGVLISASATSALIKHGDIPSAGMGAMTMEYAAPKAGMPKNLKRGDRIEFTFTMDRNGESVLTAITPLASPSSTVPPTSAVPQSATPRTSGAAGTMGDMKP